MDINKPLLVIFPYVTITEPLEIRDEVLFPSDFRTIELESISDDEDWYDKGRKERQNQVKAHVHQRLGFEQSYFDQAYVLVDEVLNYFYWYSNEQVKDVTWCYLSESTNQKRWHQFRQHLEEIRRVLGYLWCVPDSRPRFFSLYGNYDQLNYYSFVPENAIWEGGLRCIRFSPAQSRQNGDLKYVKGYRYSINQNNMGDIAGGCRLYPTSDRIFERREYSLSRILDELDRGSIKSHVPLLFSLNHDTSPQTTRVFDAIEWYNRSCYADITTDVALIYLAIAFETLLLPKRKRGREEAKLSKTQLLYESIRMIVGDFERLDQWVEQFYDARSRIVHEGQWSQLKLLVSHDKQKNQSSEYDYLTHYGWLIFRVCLNSVLAGNLHSKILDLEARFFSNHERILSIKDAIDQSNDPHETIDLIVGKIRVLADTHMQDEHATDIALLWNTGKGLADLILSLVDDPETQQQLSRISTQSYHPNFDDEEEIITYTRLVFENVKEGELPSKVINSAISDLKSDSLPSLPRIRRYVKNILRRNQLSEQLETRLKNIITLIECSFIRHQLRPLTVLSEKRKRLYINIRTPFSLIEGYAQFVTEIVDRVKSNTGLAMLQFRAQVESEVR